MKLGALLHSWKCAWPQKVVPGNDGMGVPKYRYKGGWIPTCMHAHRSFCPMPMTPPWLLTCSTDRVTLSMASPARKGRPPSPEKSPLTCSVDRVMLSMGRSLKSRPKGSSISRLRGR